MKRSAGPQKEDWIASLVVFIIAVPLSLGIALASGAAPAAGLISGVIGGIVAGALAGAPLSVTGPAAGLTALVFQLVQVHGIQGLAIITVLCGLIQLVMGLVRAGKLFTLIPKAVLEGVLSAIGLIIVLGQLHILAGQPIPKSPVLSFLTMPESYARNFGTPEYVVTPVLLCGLLAIAIQLLWSRAPKRFRWLPAALPAVVIVTLVSLFWEMPRVQIAPLLPTIQGAISTFFAMEWLGNLSTYLGPAVGVAVVASAESLLTARAVDILVAKRVGFKPANLNRELIAQGSANLVSGVVGGLPMTAVMVRSAANVNSGGQTRYSTMLHGTWIAAFVLFLPFILTRIPLTALAAILILTGIKLINLPHLIETLRKHWLEGSMWLFTAIAIFMTDLLEGLIIALVVYAIIHAKQIVAALSSRGRVKNNGLE